MMAVTLDPPVFRHGLAVAALSRVSLWRIDRADGAALSGSKHPLVVLLHDGTRLRAFDLAGRAVSGDEVETLLPGAGRAMAAAWRNQHDAAPAGFSGDMG